VIAVNCLILVSILELDSEMFFFLEGALTSSSIMFAGLMWLVFGSLEHGVMLSMLLVVPLLAGIVFLSAHPTFELQNKQIVKNA